MNCVYSRQDNREILGSDEDSLSAKLKGLFSIHIYLVTKDDNEVFFLYTQSNLATQCFKNRTKLHTS